MAARSKIQALEGSLPVSLSRCAQLVGVTEKTLRSWIANGMPTLKLGRQGSNKDRTIVDLVDVLRWYLEQDALDVAKTRLASAQADRHEMDNALRRDELADIKDVERAWAELVLACRSKLLSMPTKLAAQLTNVGDAAVVAALIRVEVLAALAELATPDSGQRGSSGAAAEGGDQVPAAAGLEGKRVGRRKPKVEQRIVS